MRGGSLGGVRRDRYTALMAGKGPKVKELARELGVSARLVITRCRAEGLAVQNRITRLQPEWERLVRAWFAEPGAPESDPPKGPEKPVRSDECG